MLRLLFLSSTSLVVLAACGDDECGPGAAPDFGIHAASADVSLTYGNLTSGQNNDCPDPDAPSGVVSLTIQGSQQDGPGLLTLCIARPDKIASGELPFGVGQVQIIDLNGEADGCSFTIDRMRPTLGTASTSGLCDNGANPAGYALTVDGNLSLTRTCPTMNDTIAVSFTGTAAIANQ